MLIVVKLFLVAFAVFGQAKIFPEAETSAASESELDTVALPADHPEWVLARRAMAAQGLCHAAKDGEEAMAKARKAQPESLSAPVPESDIGRILAASCD